MIGIYKITNIKNGKIYVGSTKRSEKRYYYHLNDLRKNTHYNIHLQRSFNIDGENSFVYSMLEECEQEKLFEREEFYIKKLNSCDDKIGYNMNTECGKPPDWTGKKHSEETKKKIGQKNKGKIISESQRKRTSEVHKGKKISEEQKAFLSKKNTGIKNPMSGRKPYDIWLEKYGKDEADSRLNDWKMKIRDGNMGRITSDETRLKLSKSIKGKKVSDETKQKLKLINLGKKASVETKRKMSLKHTGELNSACKLKDKDIKEILVLLKTNIRIVDIAKKYNVCDVTIRNIKKGKRYIP